MYFFSTAAILDFSAFLAAAPTTVNCDSAMTSCVEVKQVSFLSNLNMMMIVQFTKMKPGDSTLTHKHTHRGVVVDDALAVVVSVSLGLGRVAQHEVVLVVLAASHRDQRCLKALQARRGGPLQSRVALGAGGRANPAAAGCVPARAVRWEVAQRTQTIVREGDAGVLYTKEGTTAEVVVVETSNSVPVVATEG